MCVCEREKEQLIDFGHSSTLHCIRVYLLDAYVCIQHVLRATFYTFFNSLTIIYCCIPRNKKRFMLHNTPHMYFVYVHTGLLFVVLLFYIR